MSCTQPTMACFPADSDGNYHALYTHYIHIMYTLLALLLILLAGHCVLAVALPLIATGLPNKAVCIKFQSIHIRIMPS